MVPRRLILLLGLGYSLLASILALSMPLWGQSPRPRWVDSTLLLPESDADLQRLSPSGITLSTPRSVETRFVYDPRTGLYFLTTFLGGKPLGTPIAYTQAEYTRYMERRSTSRYWDELYRQGKSASTEKGRSPLDLRLEQSVAEWLFGKGGIRLRLQGSAELSAGLKTTHTDDPSLSERARRHTFFDFDEKIQASVQATIGTKLSFGMNYATGATFEADARRLKLTFEGNEDDIIRLIEVGNVSMTPRNSLISGGGTLFGMHTQLQMGRLQMDLLVSQQRSQTRRVSSSGGRQTEAFEISASDYDASRHFFLSEYFRSHYEGALRTLPYVRSAIQITRVELWVTNRRGQFDDARNVLAFTDLGEPELLHNGHISLSSPRLPVPANPANSLYQSLTLRPELRQIEGVTTALTPDYTASSDYERIESARRLEPSEYTLHPTLGYVSLTAALAPDEVLAVAYEFTYQGQVYRVGEFASDRPDSSTETLFVKLLKGSNLVPTSPYWPLMMRNVYSLGSGVRDVQQADFRLDVYYRDDATGIALPYLPEGPLRGQRLLSVLGLDRLDSRQEARQDGRFDFVEGYTIRSRDGLIFFPTVEPFGGTLAQALGGGGMASKYAYTELYQRTRVEAQQLAEKNKYSLRGSYRATNEGEISLGTTGVAEGSVRVMAGGQLLREGTDYSVDYGAGIVKILNKQLLETKTPIEASVQGEGGLGQQRKTVLGLDLSYQLSRSLRLGATLMHLSELPLTTKVRLGEESMRNTMWGLNFSYQSQAPWLTKLLNKLPSVEHTAPSSLSLSGEFAHLIPGHYEDKYTRGYSSLDDFESSRSTIDLMSPHAWQLSSTPVSMIPSGLTPTDYLRYGERRAQLAWFTIDPLFTRERSSLTPAYIRNDPDYVSNHFVREIPTQELFPFRDQNLSQASYLQTLSLSYYPEERGPYNLNSSALLPTGRLSAPEKSWAGIMRRIDQADFEAAGIEYLELWMMDPYVHGASPQSGELYIDLGDISEDILRDERKFFENGLPIVPTPSATENGPWGKVPTRQSVGYAFDNAAGARERQDVGLNGLSTEEEKTYPAYAAYLSALSTTLSAATREAWQRDPSSPLNDPAGDDFHHYRGADYDAARLPILERYKRYNGTEGNSQASRDDDYSQASTVSPDTEDINRDYSLNEQDRYFEYRISLRPEDLRPGRGFVVGERTAEVTLRNGQQSSVRWLQLKVPLRSFTSRVGGARDWRSIRFMRMYLTGCQQELQLRFGALRLVRGDWRTYEGQLDEQTPPAPIGDLSVTSVNIEEHGDREPVNYVLPPGVSRTLDSQQSQSLQQNEQALSIRLQGLSSGDTRAVYRSAHYDLRRYRRLQLFAHAEELVGETTPTEDGDFTLFLRLGSDYRSNYYEYSLPLRITPAGRYSSENPTDRERVWPTENFIDLALDQLIALKRRRNASIEQGLGATLYRPFSTASKEHPQHTLTILGSPSLSSIRTILIGVRNASGVTKSVEVWVNELRVGDYHEEGGWAANAQAALQLSDLGSASVRAQYISSGFGAIDQPLGARSLESRRSIHLSSGAELGRLLPEQAKVSIPLYYTLSDEVTTPEYNPTDEDVRLSEALSGLPRARRDSLLRRTITHRKTRAFSLSGVSVGIQSREPMPYDPANLSLSFGHNTTEEHTPEIEYNRHLDWQASASYDYTPTWQPLRPFKSLRGQSPWATFLRDYGLSLWPSRLSLQSTMLRSYDEEQLRSIGTDDPSSRIPATFAQRFLWSRKLSLSWAPTSSLSFTLSSGTDARIEEPHQQVNRALNPDGWRLWRDSVLRSIGEGGTPLHYAQSTTLTWQLPTARIAPLNFLTSQLSYTSSYSWDRGALVPDPSVRVANTLMAQGSIESSSQLLLRQLYRKSTYLRRLEDHYGRDIPQAETRKGGTKGKRPKQHEEQGFLSEALDRLVYTLTSLKDVTLTYRTTSQTLLPGFLPNIKAIGGQGRSGGMLTPGLAFALGLTDAGFVDQLAERGDLLLDTERPTPATFTRTVTYDLRATLQPLRDLTITLSGNHTRTDRTEVQYMYSGRPRLYGGDFTMTTIGLRGFFASPGARSGYASEPFARFLDYRRQIAQRQQSRYSSLQTSAPLEENAPAVLIPAFRAAYSQAGGVDGVSLRALPALSGMLPNWTLHYTGLTRIPLLRERFRSISLRHTYRATYTVGGFSSLAGWQGEDTDQLGLRHLPASDGSGSGTTQLSYAFDIGSVAIQESFFPLIGVEMTWNNGLGMSAQWRRSRGVVLNLSAFSIIETSSNELSLGLGYKIADLRQLLHPTPTKGRRARRAKAEPSSPKGLTLRGEYSYRRSQSLIRRIQEVVTQATSGLADTRLRLSAEYELSRLIALKAYYEWTRNVPLVSTYSFPISTTAYGLSLRLTLTN